MVESFAGERPTPGRRLRGRLRQFLGRASRSIANRTKSFTSTGSNFIYLHYTYFIVVSFFASILLWAVNHQTTILDSDGNGVENQRYLAYADALFLAVSSQSQTGLNTVDLSTLNTFQQVVLFLLVMLGSQIWVSFAIIRIRRAAFRERFSDLHQRHESQFAEIYGEQCGQDSISSTPLDESKDPDNMPSFPQLASNDTYLSSLSHLGAFDPASAEMDFTYPHEKTSFASSGTIRRESMHSADFISDTGAPCQIPSLPPRNGASVELHTTTSNSKLDIPVLTRPSPYDSYSSSATQIHPKAQSPYRQGFQIRSALAGLFSFFKRRKRKQSQRPDGIEYRALTLLSWIVLAYFIIFQLFGCIVLGLWISIRQSNIPRQNGINPWWMASFSAVSAFCNSGLSLLDKNMVPFQGSYCVLFTMTLLILAGNTCYPAFLRLIIWSLYRVCPQRSSYWSDKHQTLKYLLKNPRRCYTHLYKPRDTWWLVFVVVVLNGIDWVAFEVLNIGNDAIEQIPLGPRIMDGLFQAISVRTGGFQVVPLSQIRIGVQVLYVFMMYISAYPIILTMRTTDLGQETSPDIDYAAEEKAQSTLPASKIRTRAQFLTHQFRCLLSHDLWALGLAVWLTTIFETRKISKDPINFSIFSIFFESVSAYGTVGLTLGYPGTNYSFCGQWGVASKLVLCCVMLRGRHRGVPRWGDWAVGAPHAEKEIVVGVGIAKISANITSEMENANEAEE